MKKNKMMRLAAVLLVLTMLTTCAISGTFAKYTSTLEYTDDARVAYWGFGKEAAVTFELFANEYNSGAVKSADDENVIAPGTSKSAKFAFKYVSNTNDSITAPEVKYSVTVTPTLEGEVTKLDANENFKWTVTDAKGDVTNCANTTELLAAIKALSGSDTGEQTYAPGELPEMLVGGEDAPDGEQLVTIGWTWDYSVDDDGDVADTFMGNMDPLENLELTITITATQVNA